MMFKRMEMIFFPIIFVILLLIAIPRYFHTLEKLKEAQVLSNAYMIKEHLETFKRITGFYPPKFETRTTDINPDAPYEFSLSDSLADLKNPYGGSPYKLGDPSDTLNPSPGTVYYFPDLKKKGEKIIGVNYILLAYGGKKKKIIQLYPLEEFKR